MNNTSLHVWWEDAYMYTKRLCIKRHSLEQTPGKGWLKVMGLFSWVRCNQNLTVLHLSSKMLPNVSQIIQTVLATSFPGSLILPPFEASEERPWHTLVTCLFDNWKHQGGVLCNQAICRVERFRIQSISLCCDWHCPRCLTVLSLRDEISNIQIDAKT